MSSTAASAGTESPVEAESSRESESVPETVAGSLSEKQLRIYEHLRSNVDDRTYFKSRLIAEELGLSAKEVGANIRGVREAETDLTIEKWGYSSGTTWMVE
ncbi:hypothetical protein AArcSl_1994 [Halalkaliarchaeum desulfuricum]|uniref:DUF7123 domain-containing protein n=1 Tax=Halalkaliarchaeum desulfuricum TaxID=2055893 RepID=A0A343TKJ7_9EURY|nr:hypothetical protein [Halalkaliarchaeum desulfuricum]AUX09619.1 hypothetical protein AArcSl_1994 [Halalkaliarchaeum desulfuricum]